MTSRATIVPATPLAPLKPLPLWVGGIVLLWLLYAFVFIQTVATPAAQAFADAAVNVLPLACASALAHLAIKRRVIGQAVLTQAVVHAAGAIAFAFAWYGSVVLLYAVIRWLSGGGFIVIGFSGPGLTWQVFQGMIFYALVAASTYALAVPPARPGSDPPLERYLTRRGDGLAPVQVRDIVSITGAQDYAEVATRDGRHLVRMSLSAFERRLDPAMFKRVHRSVIVNLDHLDRAEPAGGGRMVALMANGDSVPVSRAGGHVLRSLAV